MLYVYADTYHFTSGAPKNHSKPLVKPLSLGPWRCMASCFFLLRQFEDVLVYLKSIKCLG